MAKLRSLKRQTVDDSLAIAQSERADARRAWVDGFVDALTIAFPEKKRQFEALRIDLHQASETYIDAQNNVDRVLVNRATAIVLNHQLDQEERGA